MNRFASPIVRVISEGPDVHEESLYQIFRVSNIHIFWQQFSDIHHFSRMVKFKTSAPLLLLQQADFVHVLSRFNDFAPLQ
jgi:hypothetical protein